MKFELKTSDKSGVLTSVDDYLRQYGLTVSSKDFSKPWGGFFVIVEQQADAFGKLFFPGIDINALRISGKLSPKVLVVQPHTRLSWQYHHHRAEIWRVVSGPVKVVRSLTDQETGSSVFVAGETVQLAQGERHRLVGLDTWGIVAEIWQHTDARNPSDESDIVRLQDDFGR